uniref:25S rRNA (uridine-N(3))-methyltransferase BMT5-like domain-containing protein n=1 Tax=Chromera velia CCMP2878 TaxID=1169474 RepID=A0A0G4I893_9ALVE|eukprot:Cvel_1980.t1-p1 / transcript=Cvel_1980.t1 / gene=Cvel_1980 / organism=Chromera_velia_CCMP2878 / gene_product=Uncharacterized protein At4g26485, putative / transcript_product=Uncharacterized protein At4g26485, putative / location=Cvel_scaffold75:71686-74306(+) / protein_length=835 / sequence_SO=supercontig / SO=protein_coding / is_pseudo=false
MSRELRRVSKLLRVAAHLPKIAPLSSRLQKIQGSDFFHHTVASAQGPRPSTTTVADHSLAPSVMSSETVGKAHTQASKSFTDKTGHPDQISDPGGVHSMGSLPEGSPPHSAPTGDGTHPAASDSQHSSFPAVSKVSDQTGDPSLSVSENTPLPSPPPQSVSAEEVSSPSLDLGETQSDEVKQKDVRKTTLSHPLPLVQTGDGTRELFADVSYSSADRILLVGEGDFSFSLALSHALGPSVRIVATSPEEVGTLETAYGRRTVRKNLQTLEKRGCTVVHDLSAAALHSSLGNCAFEKIVFNFPLVKPSPAAVKAFAEQRGETPKEKGYDPNKQRLEYVLLSELLKKFFKAASPLLSGSGEIHLRLTDNHATCKGLHTAGLYGLRLVQRVDFGGDAAEIFRSLGYRPAPITLLGSGGEVEEKKKKREVMLRRDKEGKVVGVQRRRGRPFSLAHSSTFVFCQAESAEETEEKRERERGVRATPDIPLSSSSLSSATRKSVQSGFLARNDSDGSSASLRADSLDFLTAELRLRSEAEAAFHHRRAEEMALQSAAVSDGMGGGEDALELIRRFYEEGGRGQSENGEEEEAEFEEDEERVLERGWGEQFAQSSSRGRERGISISKRQPETEFGQPVRERWGRTEHFDRLTGDVSDDGGPNGMGVGVGSDVFREKPGGFLLEEEDLGEVEWPDLEGGGEGGKGGRRGELQGTRADRSPRVVSAQRENGRLWEGGGKNYKRDRTALPGAASSSSSQPAALSRPSPTDAVRGLSLAQRKSGRPGMLLTQRYGGPGKQVSLLKKAGIPTDRATRMVFGREKPLRDAEGLQREARRPNSSASKPLH